MLKVIHSMLRVANEQASLDFYQNALNFTLKQVRDFSDFKLIYLQDSGSSFELELTVNKDNSGAYEMGSGYGHMALVSNDLEALHKHISDLGYQPKPIKTFAPEGQFVAEFFFVKDPDGYDIEIIKRSERYN